MWKPDPISATGAADTIQETGNRGDQQLTHLDTHTREENDIIGPKYIETHRGRVQIDT